MVGRGRDQLHAGGRALAHVVVQAGAHAVFHGPVRAAAQGKGAVDQLPGFPRVKRRSERPEIARAVASCPAHDFQTRERMLEVEPEENVLLVVAQHDIIVRPMLLDQARFQQQGLFFRGGGQIVQADSMGQHGPGLGGQAVRPEVGEHAPPQNAGLAHIDDAAPAVLVQIYAGRERYGGGVGFLHILFIPKGRGPAKPRRH